MYDAAMLNNSRHSKPARLQDAIAIFWQLLSGAWILSLMLALQNTQFTAVQLQARSL